MIFHHASRLLATRTGGRKESDQQAASTAGLQHTPVAETLAGEEALVPTTAEHADRQLVDAVEATVCRCGA